jgi:hypothetical protein
MKVCRADRGFEYEVQRAAQDVPYPQYQTQAAQMAAVK